MEITQMKTNTKLLFTLLSFLIISISLSANSINSIFNKYGSEANADIISISKPMIAFASAFVDKDTKKVLSKISNMKIITSDNFNAHSSLVNEITALAKKENFEKLVEVRDKGDRVNIYFNEPGNNKNSDVLIVANSDKDLTMVWLRGKFSLNDLEELSNLNL